MPYLSNTRQDQATLLQAIGAADLNALFSEVPSSVKYPALSILPPPLSEIELLEEISCLTEKNQPGLSFLGGGSYPHFIPSVVKHIASRSEFYTAYTPYQAEASQGILQIIYEFQSMLCQLTGMDAANASMYDGATSLAEAAFLACRVTQRKKILASAAIHPAYLKVLTTYAKGAGLVVELVNFDQQGQTAGDFTLAPDVAGFFLQQPNFFGCLEKVSGLADKCHANGSLLTVSVDPLSLGLLKAPGDYGADIVTGEGQALGNPISFGGPGLGLFAVKKNLIRHLPGRIVGKTVDAEGKTAFCLTLQTREQHIRREKAFSNICSNEALAALSATVYLSVMGKVGLKKVAELCLQKAHYLKDQLIKNGIPLVFSTPFFKELAIKSDYPVGLDLSVYFPALKGTRLLCVTELYKKEQLDNLVQNIKHARQR